MAVSLNSMLLSPCLHLTMATQLLISLSMPQGSDSTHRHEVPSITEVLFEQLIQGSYVRLCLISCTWRCVRSYLAIHLQLPCSTLTVTLSLAS